MANRTGGGNPTSGARKSSGFDDGSFPVFDEKSAKSAIKLRGHGKAHSASEVLSHVMQRCHRLVKEGRMSPGAMRRIEKLVMQARQNDKANS